jgi:galactokinase
VFPDRVDAAELRRVFDELYGADPRLFRAPGRVNLIGEHTDYNDGWVLPVAIDRATFVAAAPRRDRRVRVRSLDLDAAAEFDLDRPGPPRRSGWLDYVEGVAVALERRGLRLAGADLLLQSEVSIGGGLSSSAALEVSVGLALAAVSGREIDATELALAGQAAEHDHVGIQSGIMDQLTAVRGRAGHALLLDCRSLESEAVPLALPGTSLVVCDSLVRHELASSEYNTRRSECERGAVLLARELPGVRALRDVTVEQFAEREHLLPEPIRRRCRHVIAENRRTLAAAGALAAGEDAVIGRLMAESHRSLRDDYEVSCPELDLLVALAREIPGAAGARMTGGGFGGCTINLVRRDAVAAFRERIMREYARRTGREPVVFAVESSNGASEILD